MKMPNESDVTGREGYDERRTPGSSGPTPGDWRVVRYEDQFAGIDADDVSIVHMGAQTTEDAGGVRGRTAEESLTNALLMAASPIMANTLRDTREVLQILCERIDRALEQAGQ